MTWIIVGIVLYVFVGGFVAGLAEVDVDYDGFGGTFLLVALWPIVLVGGIGVTLGEEALTRLRNR